MTKDQLFEVIDYLDINPMGKEEIKKMITQYSTAQVVRALGRVKKANTIEDWEGTILVSRVAESLSVSSEIRTILTELGENETN